MGENENSIVNDLGTQVILVYGHYVITHVEDPDLHMPQGIPLDQPYQVFKSYSQGLVSEEYVTPFMRGLFTAVFHLTSDISEGLLPSGIDHVPRDIENIAKKEKDYFGMLSQATDEEYGSGIKMVREGLTDLTNVYERVGLEAPQKLRGEVEKIIERTISGLSSNPHQ